MDVKELKSHLNNYESDSPCIKSDLAKVTLPLFVLYDKILTTINKMLHERYKLTNTEIDVLSSLRHSGNNEYKLSPTKLYERLLFSSGGMTKVLKKLETKNYIKRLDNPDDGRSKLVQLTQEGEDVLVKAINDIIIMEEDMFKHLDTKDREGLSTFLFKALEPPEED
ncbi:MarR family winged helix-turn-helix transcriptional regulator [Sulfurimonas sp.]